MTGIHIGKDFKLVGGKVVKDHAAAEKKLDVSTRLKRRASKRVKVAKRTV